MIPYYLLFAVVYMSAYYDLCKGDSLQIRKSFYCLVLFMTAVCFIVFAGLKGDVGTDYKGYYNIYNIYGKLEYSDPLVSLQVEPGFWFLCRLFNSLKFPFPVFWFFIACLTLFTKFIFFRRFSPYLFLSLLIYLSGLFIERDFDGIRQGLSVGLAYMAILHYLDGRKMLYCLFLFFAVSVHYSSLVFLIIPILYRVRVSDCLVYLVIGAGFAILVLRVSIISFVLEFLPEGYIISRISTYLMQSSYSNSIGMNLGIVVRIAILVLFCNIDCKKISMPGNVYNFLRNGFLFSILCFLFLNDMEILAHRLAYGFREFQILLVPICFKHYIMDRRYPNGDKFLGFQLYCLYAFALFYRMINATHLKEYYEYRFIF